VVQLVAWHDRNIPRTRPGVARALGALGERDLRRLLDAGAVVTLSRDDPTFLGGLTLTEELRRAAEFAYMSREELLACQEAAVDAASCGPETKNFLRRALAEFQQS